MIKAVIFDMDGVLIDSQTLHYQSDVDAIAKAGKTASLSDVEPYAGVSAADRFDAYKKTFGLPQPLDQLVEWQTRIFMDLFHKAKTVPINGIRELLIKIKEKNLKTAVASSSSVGLIDLVLKKTELAAFFDALVSGENVPEGKPAPDVFLHAAKLLETPPVNCAVVEDSPNGILAAKRSGMYCVAYLNKYTGLAGSDVLKKADVAVEDYEDCYGFLLPD